MSQSTYVPVAGDFEFLTGRDITTDKNFASQSYWKGVAIHFYRNRRAMIGVFIVGVLSLFFTAGNYKHNPNLDENGTAV